MGIGQKPRVNPTSGPSSSTNSFSLSQPPFPQLENEGGG